MDATETEELEKIRKKAMDEVTSALQALENKFPGITEGAAALAGSGVGAAASFGALYTLGTTGVSAAGITSGLATAGSIVGGGMVAGIAVLYRTCSCVRDWRVRDSETQKKCETDSRP